VSLNASSFCSRHPVIVTGLDASPFERLAFFAAPDGNGVAGAVEVATIGFAAGAALTGVASCAMNTIAPIDTNATSETNTAFAIAGDRIGAFFCINCVRCIDTSIRLRASRYGETGSKRKADATGKIAFIVEVDVTRPTRAGTHRRFCDRSYACSEGRRISALVRRTSTAAENNNTSPTAGTTPTAHISQV